MKKRLVLKQSKEKRALVPGGVREYIAGCPKDAQRTLKELRAAIRSVSPTAVETLSYFDMPGYSYAGYPYNGMFVWFSFKAPYVSIKRRPRTTSPRRR
jgi:uncharacterized protein YdhG (YjbR/CyaY superfamily)